MKPIPEATRAPSERAVVAALLVQGSDAAQAHDPTDEITALAEAAGAKVIDAVVQRARSPHPRTGFRRGKVTEIKELCEQQKADLVVVDFDLSPTQGQNLEKDIGLRVVDRTELILDIFANRARTKQAMLQVELAQAEYMRPRLKRLWTHLERMEGAIGARGPGETQLESDRRMVDQRISRLRRRLGEIEDRSRRQAESRTLATTISLMGYTNAGKSSLMARLTGSDVYIADQLFATLDTRVRKWKLEDRREVLLADTVGFVRDLPHHLVASFHATLEETLHADLLLHVCDASDPDLELHLKAVDQVLGGLEADEIPRLLILNKTDLIGDRELNTLLATHPGAVPISVVSGAGLDRLDQRICEQLDAWSLNLEVELPAAAGDVLSAIRRFAVIQSDEFSGETWQARLRVSPRAWGGLQVDLARAGGRFRAV